jgi:hypothetical protein
MLYQHKNSCPSEKWSIGKSCHSKNQITLTKLVSLGMGIVPSGLVLPRPVAVFPTRLERWSRVPAVGMQFGPMEELKIASISIIRVLLKMAKEVRQ